MMKTIIRCPDNMVMVFDEEGEQILECQHRYEKVKECILQKVPPDAVFYHMCYAAPILRKVKKEEW